MGFKSVLISGRTLVGFITEHVMDEGGNWG